MSENNNIQDIAIKQIIFGENYPYGSDEYYENMLGKEKMTPEEANEFWTRMADSRCDLIPTPPMKEAFDIQKEWESAKDDYFKIYRYF